MVSGKWNDVFMSIVMGMLTYIVVDELISAFDLGDGAGASIIKDLIPMAIGILVVVTAFRGIGDHNNGLGGSMGGRF